MLIDKLNKQFEKCFQMAIDKVNQLNPDFVITGGDLVFDAMRGNRQKSDSLFTLYKNMSAGFKMPVYNCIGNHDLFAIYSESPENENHPDYKYGMFERYFGKTYYSFGHKGWHFIVLNSLDVTEDKKYKGHFHEKQLEWLKSQGHIHWKEYGSVNDRFEYITGGSIAGNGWKGRRHNTKEGFVYLKVNGDDFSWEYIDHGWEDERMKMN